MADRGICRCCKNEYSVNADGTVRYHIATDPECRDAEDSNSRKCRGAGQPPVEQVCDNCGHTGHGLADYLRNHANDDLLDNCLVCPCASEIREMNGQEPVSGYICRVCHHPVQLTANRRARSHLNPQGEKCPGGSDWPLAVDEKGQRTDTRPVDPHAHEADVAIAEAERIQREQDLAYEQSLRDGLEESRRKVAASRPDALISELKAEAGDPGTVARQLDAYREAATGPDCPPHDYGTWDGADGETVDACERCGKILPEIMGQLDTGDLFTRRGFAFRVTAVAPDRIEAVVTEGPHAGMSGQFTDLLEEITCTGSDATRAPTHSPRPTNRTSPTSSTPTSPTTPDRSTGRSSMPTTTAPAKSAPCPSSPAISSGASTAGTPASTSTPPASTSGLGTAPMTPEQQAAAYLAEAAGSRGEDEAEYGDYGWYKLRHPDTGKVVHWQRATTFAKLITDTFTLDQWQRRCVLIGATKRPDIVALAHGKDITKDREQLNKWTEELKVAAGSKIAANLGTAVHSFTENCDRAEHPASVLPTLPKDYRPHVEAYLIMLEEYGLRALPTLIEFSTGVQQYEVMGTSDRCYLVTKHIDVRLPRKVVHLSPGDFVIGDVKTGKDLDYGWQEICIQLAMYAHGLNTLGRFVWKTKTWDKDPLAAYAEPGTKVRTDVAIILHLPVDPLSPKKPGLHGIDLESGWNAAVLCERTRAWRKIKNLAGPVLVVNGPETKSEAAPKGTIPAAGPRVVREPTLRERAEAITSSAEASAVYQVAVKAKRPVAEVQELIEVMQARIAAMAEPGGNKR